jgi:hypothetical protein
MMVSGSSVRQVPRFLLDGFGGIRGAVLEAEAVVSGFENVAALSEAIAELVNDRVQILWVARQTGATAGVDVKRT